MTDQIFSMKLWSPVCLRLLEWHRIGRQLRHAGAAVQIDVQDGSSRLGHMLWVGQVDGQEIALCWAWREVLPNVVALSDPLGISSNVVLFDARGDLLDEAKRILKLNAAVNRLPWQATVRHPRAVAHVLAS